MTTTINDDYKKLLFYANSLIAGVLNSNTPFKNCQINSIKNEFNKRVLLLEKQKQKQQHILIEEEEKKIVPIIPTPFSSTDNNIMLIITPKK